LDRAFASGVPYLVNVVTDRPTHPGRRTWAERARSGAGEPGAGISVPSGAMSYDADASRKRVPTNSVSSVASRPSIA